MLRALRNVCDEDTHTHTQTATDTVRATSAQQTAQQQQQRTSVCVCARAKTILFASAFAFAFAFASAFACASVLRSIAPLLSLSAAKTLKQDPNLLASSTVCNCLSVRLCVSATIRATQSQPNSPKTDSSQKPELFPLSFVLSFSEKPFGVCFVVVVEIEIQ